jgi:hypothetical protein
VVAACIGSRESNVPEWGEAVGPYGKILAQRSDGMMKLEKISNRIINEVAG